mgnify:CR=1 FL=1
MTALWVLAGLGLGLAARAGLLLAIAVLGRAGATLLPPVGQFLGDVQQVREWSARRTEEQERRHRAAPAPGEVERPRPGDLLQPQHVAVETPAAFDIGDEDRDVIDQGYADSRHGMSLITK